MGLPIEEKDKRPYTRDQKAVLNKYAKLHKHSSEATSATFFNKLDKRIKQANR
ncbi:hypothetical protein K8O68_03760 [Salipaludibacillus sp. CUR1]|uniref:hypothetical protein n=1 Tax=Salipaludibacillus sp. CUR1 TaxID=2820003 RepID=UPI001E5BB754|nr:hypothetical protein [Salipaludibacillus sp. CUR1]MCE7791541.1 hypothetical protein [Salipaludibacillus sp. CUR1]